VITMFKPAILKATSASPGVAKLNKAGMAINSENKGINTNVLLRKNPKFILEKYARTRDAIYKYNKIIMSFANNI